MPYKDETIFWQCIVSIINYVQWITLTFGYPFVIFSLLLRIKLRVTHEL